MLTDDIATADAERDGLYSGYKKAVNGFQNLPVENMAKAAKVLTQHIKDYAIYPKMQLGKETGLLMNFIDDLEKKYSSEVQTLSLGAFVTALKAANEKVRTLTATRTDERMAKAVGALVMAWQETSPMMNFQRKRSEDASIRTRWCLKLNLNKQIEENKSLRAENDTLKTEKNKVKQRISQLDEKAVERVTTQLVCAKEELASAKSYNTTLMEMYNDLKARWNAIWQEPEMTDAWRRVEARKEKETKEKARQEAEAKRESMARQNRYIGVLDKFIHEGHEALSSFAKTDRVNFNEKESASIYYGIMASAVKHNIGLDSKASIESAAKSFLSGMSWKGFTDFKQECVTNWTKLFATNEVQFTDNAIDNFLAFVDHMLCSADTYVSLGGSNGCADQLTNWDGTQKLGLGSSPKKKSQDLSRK